MPTRFDGSVKHWYQMSAAPASARTAGASVGSTWTLATGAMYRFQMASPWWVKVESQDATNDISADGTSAGTFTVNADASGLALSSSGLTGTRTITFPDVTATAATFQTAPDADNRVLRSDGTAGKAQSSTVEITDAGAVSGITTLATTGAITQNGNAVLDATSAGYVAALAQIAALGAENTDGRMSAHCTDFRVVSGGWSIAVGSNGNPVLRRTAAATNEIAMYPLSTPHRMSANKGRKITALHAVYSVTTADVTDVTLELVKLTRPDDNSGMAAMTTIAGAVDGDYETSHNTAAKRGDSTGAPEYHTCLVTVSSPAYIGDGEQYALLFRVQGSATGVVDLYMADVGFSETLVDLS